MDMGAEAERRCGPKALKDVLFNFKQARNLPSRRSAVRPINANRREREVKAAGCGRDTGVVAAWVTQSHSFCH